MFRHVGMSRRESLHMQFVNDSLGPGSSKQPISASYDLSTEPVFTFTDTAGAFSNGNRFGLTKYNLETRQSFEELWQARIDYSHPIDIGHDSTIKIGAKYLDRHKFNNQDKQDYKNGTS